jgi:hypothetical protein
MKKNKMSVIECLFGIAKIDSQQKRIAKGEDLEFNKKVTEEANKLTTEFYKTFNKDAFIQSLKDIVLNK